MRDEDGRDAGGGGGVSSGIGQWVRADTERELGLMLDMKKRDVGGDTRNDAARDPGDEAYYTRKYEAERAGVDEAALRRYFSLEHVFDLRGAAEPKVREGGGRNAVALDT